MPIFPRYEGSTQVATPNTPMPPTEDLRSKQIEKLGESAVQVGLAGRSVAERFKYLKDVTDAGAAYQKAVKEQQDEMETYRGLNAEDAKAKFDKFVDTRQGDWYKGLSKEASYNLQHDLYPKTIENSAFAHKLAHRFEVDKAGATAIGYELDFQRAINDGHIQTDPKDSPEYQKYARQIDAGVLSGLYEQKHGEAEKRRVLQVGSYDMAYRWASDAPEKFRAAYKEYESSKGAYVGENQWFKNIGAKELAQLDGHARERMWSELSQKHTLATWTQQEQDRTDTVAREKAEIDLAKKTNKGTLTEQDVDRYSELRLVTGEKTNFWYAAARNELLQGGPGNPEIRRSLAFEVAQADAGLTSNADLERVRNKVMAAAVAKQVPKDEAMALIAKIKDAAGSENTQINRDTTEAKAILMQALSFSGAFNKPSGDEIQAKTDGLIMLAANKRAAKPEDPFVLIQRELPGLRSRATPAGQMRENEGRKSLGLPPAPKEGDDVPAQKKAQQLIGELRDMEQRGLKSTPEYKKKRQQAETLVDAVNQGRANAENRKGREEAKKLRDEQRRTKEGAPAPLPPPKEQ